MTNNKVTRHEEGKTEERYYDKYPLIKLVISSGTNHITGKSWTSRRVEPNGAPTKRAYLEQLVAFRKGVKIELPYTIEVGFDNRFEDDEAVKWYEAQFQNVKPPINGANVVIDAEDLELGGDDDQ